MPRSIKDFRSYKATEFFNWLLYYSLATLNGFMPDIYLQHWMLLVIAIYNLVRQRISISIHIKQSEELLDLFVKQIPSLYGEPELCTSFCIWDCLFVVMK